MPSICRPLSTASSTTPRSSPPFIPRPRLPHGTSAQLLPRHALCAVPDCVHQGRTSLHTTQLPKLDHAILNAVVPCYIRLLDVKDTLAEHCWMCAFTVASSPRPQICGS
ncbi:hypothetical protein V8C44DRAFT_337189 [Trichoderma aethiopicum]